MSMKNPPEWARRLASSLEDPSVLGEGEGEIDGMRPAITARPRSAEEVAAVIAFAADEQLAVVPRGGGTAMHLGNKPTRVDILLSLGGLRDGFEHSHEDLVATLPAGMTVGDANSRLEESGQGLPLDPPSMDDATLGGVLAANSIGPRVQWFGMPRGWVLGTTVVHPDGSITKTGGKVVKNVTGYDLARAYVGSLGTLGVITSATLKLQPLPQATVSLGMGFPTMDGAMRTAEEILEAGLRPLALSALSGPSTETLGLNLHPVLLLIEFGGPDAVVNRQVGEARRVGEERGVARDAHYRGQKGRNVWRGVADFPGSSWGTVFRCSLPPAAVGPFIDVLSEAFRAVGLTESLLVHAGRGIVFAGTPLPLSHDQLATLFEELTAVGVSMGGFVILEKTSPELKQDLDVWGSKPDGFEVMARLKGEFDSHRILNPGRYVGGL